MATEETVLEVDDLYKTYRIGFFRKRVEAVRGISFKVQRGEIFGFIGPNGAGKTTTIKAILQLIYPSKGVARLFGRETGYPEARKRLGYMPESPYIYQYLKPLEFLDLCGRLAGMKGEPLRKQSREMLESLGLGHAVDRPIGKFSKGMLQRIGLAQALLHEPELLILDEPFTGLDPVGRKDVREVLVEHRNRGGTILFTSHTLSDVEMLCDRVAIIRAGLLAAYGELGELLMPTERRIEIELERVSPELRQEIEKLADKVQGERELLTAVVNGDEVIPQLLERALQNGARVLAVRPHRDTLENLFLRHAEAEARAADRTAQE
jgi:ABC-2 type transport system ATP-binding protein